MFSCNISVLRANVTIKFRAILNRERLHTWWWQYINHCKYYLKQIYLTLTGTTTLSESGIGSNDKVYYHTHDAIGVFKALTTRKENNETNYQKNLEL